MARNQLIEIQAPGLEEVRARLGSLQSKAPNVMARAINKTIIHVNKLMAEEARKEYIVKAGAVKKTIRVRKATAASLSAQAISKSGEKIKLIGYKASPASPRPSSPPKFYKSQVKQKSGLKSLTGSGDRSTGFVAVMASGHKGVFQRQVGRGRKGKEPIAELSGLSIPAMFTNHRLSNDVRDKGWEFLHKTLDHEIKRILEAGV